MSAQLSNIDIFFLCDTMCQIRLNYLPYRIMTTHHCAIIIMTDKPQCLPGQKLKYGVTVGKSVLVICKVRANPRANTEITLKYGQFEYKTSGEYDTEDDTVYSANVTHKVRYNHKH